MLYFLPSVVSRFFILEQYNKAACYNQSVSHFKSSLALEPLNEQLICTLLAFVCNDVATIMSFKSMFCGTTDVSSLSNIVPQC